MFSESFDMIQNDKLKELEENIWDNIDEKEEGKNGQEKWSDEKVKILKSEISSKMTEYRSFFDSFPNAFHEDISQLTWLEKVQTFMASEIGWITEKKIKWFDRNLWDGKKAEVREEWWQIYLKITQEWKGWNNKELSISLNNFESIKNDKKDGENTIQPTIAINWDESLLNDLLGNNNWNNNESEWWNITSKVLNMDKDTELFKKVFNSVHENIISKEIQDFHGYIKFANDKTLEVKADFLLKKGYEDEDINLDNKDYEEYLDFFIDTLVRNIEEPNLKQNDLIVLESLLALCWILRINSGNGIQDIKRTLWFTEEKNIWKEKTVQWWENLIEFLPINESDLEHFIACREDLKNMCVNTLSKEKEKYLSNAIEYQNDPKVWKINKILNCLNK